MKKVKMIIAVMLMSCLMATSVLASGIMPHDSTGAFTMAKLYVNGTTASISVAYQGTADSTGASFYIRLQRYEDGEWKNYSGAWYEQTNNTYANYNKTATVEAGYTYRVEVHCFLYSPNGNANFYVYSNQSP